MTARWTSEATGKTCTKCGVHADAGRVFCANCGAALQTPLTLIRPTLEDYSSPGIMRPARGTVTKIHSARLRTFCGARHRARHNQPRSWDLSSLGLHRSLSPRRRSAGSIWHVHKESVGYQPKGGELSGLRLSGAESAATEISKAGALGWLDLPEVRLRDG